MTVGSASVAYHVAGTVGYTPAQRLVLPTSVHVTDLRSPSESYF